MVRLENSQSSNATKFATTTAWMVAIYQFFNFIAFSTHGHDVAAIRFAREPVLLLLLVMLFWNKPGENPAVGTGFKHLALVFFMFLLYAVFNCIFSLSLFDSLQYYSWLFAALIFYYKLIWNPPTSIPFKATLFETAQLLFILQIGIVVFSYIGGYLLGRDDYFDVRFNEVSGEFKLEFGGMFCSTNAFGILMYQTVALGLVVLAKPGLKFRFGVYVSLAVLAVLIIQINNRSSLLCLAGFVLMVLIFYYKNHILAFSMLIALILSFFIMPDFVQDKLRLNQFEGNKRFGNRTELIENGLFIAKEMNFFGVGYYNQRTALRAYGVVEESDKVLNLHNTYLALFIELGFVGSVIFLGGILLILGKAIWSVKDPENKPITTILVCAILSLMLFHSTVEDSFNSPGSPTFNFFWFLLLMMLAISDEKPSLAIKS